MSEKGKDEDGLDTGKMFNAEQQKVIDGIIKGKVSKLSAKHKVELEAAGKASIANLAGKFDLKPEEMESVLNKSVTKERLADIADEAEKMGLEPAVLLQIKDLETFKADTIAQEEAAIKIKKQKDASVTEIKNQLAEFAVSHPDIDIEKLNSDEDFFEYYGTLSPDVKFGKAYDSYIKLIGTARASELAEKAAKDERSTGTGSATGGSHFGLSEKQRALAKDNEMTEKAFAEGLKKSAYYNK